MNIIEVTSLEEKGVELYSCLTERQLRQGSAGGRHGVFIAESPKVIAVALSAGYEPVSLLCERRHIDGDAKNVLTEISERWGDIPIYTGERELLSRLTGYVLTRGVLCAMRRKPVPTVAEICADAHRVAVMHGVCDSTNIGAIFRSAAALGIDALVLSRDSCDPLNRRAIRVSMGTVFLLPWAWADDYDSELHTLGFKLAALALADDYVPISSPMLKAEERLAIVMGTEGDGLPRKAITDADYVVKIPMNRGVDSLNVAAASAVAFWELRV